MMERNALGFGLSFVGFCVIFLVFILVALVAAFLYMKVKGSRNQKNFYSLKKAIVSVITAVVSIMAVCGFIEWVMTCPLLMKGM